MNPPKNRLEHRTAEEMDAGHAGSSEVRSESVREFASPEELLRHDRAETKAPASLAARVEGSVASAPAPAPKPWWKRLL